MHTWKKRITTVVAVIFLLQSLFICSGYCATKAQNLDAQIQFQEREYKKLQNQIKNTNKKINDTKKKERSVARQLETLGQKITLTQQKVNVINLKVVRVKGNIGRLTKEIDSKEKEIEKTKELLKSRFIAIYKYGGVTEFNLLMSSCGTQDALNTSYLLSKIAKEDQHLIARLERESAGLRDICDNLKKEQVSYENHMSNLRAEKRKLNNAASEQNKTLKQVRREKSLYIAQQKEFRNASKELQNKVNRLIAEKRKLRASQKRGIPTTYYKGGRLMWPAQGKITSRFGTRVHPVFKTKTTHTGLDIAAPKGNPVRAANSGEVLYTGWMRGYGQVIIIDHGANLTTVYAHLSRILCQEDEKVRRGQQIGSIGSTGVATGNHLHFEVRVNGRAVDPMKYLR